MKKYNVIFTVYYADSHSEKVTIAVEAGNKKAAYSRALSSVSKDPKYSDQYKKIINIEEVA